MVRRGVVPGLLLGALLFCAAVSGTLRPASAAEPGREAAPVAAAPVDHEIAGLWTGAKLRCQKEEGKLVRCGTPNPFAITFAADGHGTSADDAFPKEFRWRWIAPTEIGILPTGATEELKLFGVEREETSMTFQAYIYPPASDPNQPSESRYIHFIFDVNRAE